MSQDFVIADLHLGHQRLIDGWPNEGGVTIANSGPRGQFPTVEAMWETIRDNAVRCMDRRDKLWILGDIAMNNTSLRLLKELPIDLYAIGGNHDQAKPAVYAEVFKGFYGAKTMDGILMTHIPIHPSSLSRRSMQINVHGHLHDEVVMFGSEVGAMKKFKDPRYVCVSCEQVDYTPVRLDIIRFHAERLGLLQDPKTLNRDGSQKEKTPK